MVESWTGTCKGYGRMSRQPGLSFGCRAASHMTVLVFVRAPQSGKELAAGW